MCKKMADEQPNSQSSQLHDEDLNKLEESVSENNACNSSMQSGEVLKGMLLKLGMGNGEWGMRNEK